jgi:predicted MPP superfamily phosphohydrolase
MSLTRVLMFLAVSMSIVFGLHYYIWARLVRDPALPSPWRGVATGALVALAASMPLSFLLLRALGGRPMKFLVWPVYVWMGLMMLIFTLLVAGDVMRLVAMLGARAVRGAPVDNPERRLALARLFGGAVALAATGLGALAVRTALKRVALREHEVKLDRLPRALDGTSIVQMTDVHIGPTIGGAFLTELVARTNALKPDLVVITGDLVDGPVAQLREAVAPIAALQARWGVYFVTGNHEYYSGVTEWIAELSRLGVRVLRNERVAVGDGAHTFDLAGIDDHSSTGLAPGHGPDLPRALDGRDPARELVLLAHQPRAIHEAARHGVGLQLSGHTHGGQIFPWMFFVRLQQPYVVGFAREGDTQLYVSPGTGYWGPPMRLGTEAELTRIILRSPA